MTTTLRPAEPLQRGSAGALSRRFQVCVNGRPVGAVRLSTHPEYGPEVARVQDLRIEEPDRGRGRAAVAALAAEEIARGWGCGRVEVSVPADAVAALRLATALGYVQRNRNMAKRLAAEAPRLPAGSAARPMTEAEYGPWAAQVTQRLAESLVARGVPEAEARRKSAQAHARLLPDGPASENTLISVLEHEAVPVGSLWLALLPDMAYVYDVGVYPDRRGHGHGRTLMLLAEAQATAGGRDRIALNVFANNTPAERLYASLGYETTEYHLYKSLL
ncbi:GNAT family N-acetyltransferase [Streptomyces sp. NPDC086787]|uniref:GNAT family N-acetyltransferase n=1 Tax=Streptomyces sp. NPDC086787 TaxID=3365759 RepID=UPI003822E4CD